MLESTGFNGSGGAHKSAAVDRKALAVLGQGTIGALTRYKEISETTPGSLALIDEATEIQNRVNWRSNIQNDDGCKFVFASAVLDVLNENDSLLARDMNKVLKTAVRPNIKVDAHPVSETAPG